MRKFKNTNALHQSQKTLHLEKKKKKSWGLWMWTNCEPADDEWNRISAWFSVRWLRFWSCGRVQRQFSVEESNLAASYQRMMLARLSGTLDCCSCQQRCTPRSHRASICSLCWATQWGGSIVEVVLERRETCLSHWDGYSFMMEISKHCVLW